MAIKKVWLIVIGILTGMIISYFVRGNFFSGLEEQLFSVSDVSALVIEARNSRVEVLPSPDSEIRVVAEGRIAKTIRMGVEDSTLVVNTRERRHWPTILLFPQRELLSVYLPQQQYEALTISGRNGSVIVEDVNVNQLAIDVRNGRVEMNEIRADQIDARTQNGRLVLRNIDSLETVAFSRNGNVNLEHVLGDLQVEARNGRINMRAATIEQNIDFETRNGRISIELDEEPENATFMLSARNGSTRLFGESFNHRSFGEGEYTVRLSTRNGNIRVD